MSAAFTEAELAAAEWRKAMKIATTKPVNGESGITRQAQSRFTERDRRGERRPRSRSRSRERERERKRDRSRSRDRHHKSHKDRSRDHSRERSHDSHSHRRTQQHDSHRSTRSRSPSVRTKERRDKKEKKEEETVLDEFGRSVPKSLYLRRQAELRQIAEDEERESDRDRRRSSSRDEDKRRAAQSDWRHDRFREEESDTEVEERVQRREQAGNYRAPSPEWISKAGGVAIMRKKQH